MTYKLTVVDNTTTLSVTETPVLITEQVAGIQGPAGSTGTAATVAVGSTSTGAAGTNASVTNSGTSSAATFNFTIPRGNTGEKGADGTDGAAATIAVNSTSTGAAGTNATVTNVGTSSAASLNFVIPRGADGNNGTNGQGYTAKGTYSSGTTYAAYDVVYYSLTGNSYRAKSATTGNAPTNTTYWERMTDAWSIPSSYSGSEFYGVGSTVTYLGSSYYCFNAPPSSGYTPTDTTYWLRIAAKGDTGSIGPTGPQGTQYAQVLTSSTTGNGTTLTPIFPSGSQAIALTAGLTYFFEGFVSISKVGSGSSANFSVGFTFSQTQQNLNYQISMTSASSTAATFQASNNLTATSVNVGTAGTTAGTGLIRYSGFFQANGTTGGTLTPTFAQSSAPTSGNPSANIGSYFRLIPMASSYGVIAGTWS
jgi:hypothetical protein